MLGIIIGVVSIVFELFLLWLLITKIKRYKSLSIQDTIVYPLLVVLMVILLTLSRLIYTDIEFFDAVKESFGDALGIVTLSINKEMTDIFMQQSIPLLVAYYGGYVISMVALSSLAIYCLNITIRNFIRLAQSLLKGKEVILVFGFNEDAKNMMKNFEGTNTKMTCVLDSGVIEKYVDEKTFLDKFGIGYIEAPYKEKKDYLNSIKKVIKWRNKRYTLITFFEEDKKNDEFSSAIIKYLRNPKLNKGNARFIMNVNSTQETFLQKKYYDPQTGKDILKGKLRTYNKYDLNSYLFAKEHTFSKYLNFLTSQGENFINDDCTLGDVDIHCYFIGFGKINQPLLRDVLVNNQFVKKVKTDKGYVLEPYQIKVDVFDENMKCKALALAHGLFKYHKDDCNPEDYLDLPHDYISNVKINMHTSIEETNLINHIYDDVKSRIKEAHNKQVNFFFVSLDSDMYNVLIADNLKKNIDAISESYNFFFVRKADLTDDDVETDYCKYMGCDDILFSSQNVLLDNIYAAAKKEHFIYSRKGGNVDDLWNELPKIKQQSNLYAILGLYFKKDLLKGDYQKSYNPHNVKQVADEDIDRLIKPQKAFDPIDVLAFSEHERWNAFEFSQGVCPMKISMFNKLNENTKEGDYPVNQTKDRNYHFCITTQKGLVEYYNLYKKHQYDGANVIAYDYDLMDHFVAHENVLNDQEN